MTHPAARLLQAGLFSSPRSAPPANDDRPDLLQTSAEREYRRMQRAFLTSGGMVDSDTLTGWLRSRTDQPVSRLARWIVAHDVISLAWQGRTLLPVFQFDATTLAPHPAVSRVIRELYPVLDDWEVGMWFAEPNLWLDGASPVEAILSEPREVFEAARGYRFLANA